MAVDDSEAMSLFLSDLNRMKQEFLEVYEKLFNDSVPRLRRALQLKLKAMNLCDQRDEQERLTNRTLRNSNRNINNN